MKKKNMLIVLMACVALVAALALCACSGNSAQDQKPAGNTPSASTDIKLLDPGKVSVAASLDFPPFENIDPQTEEPIGFDIDIMKALCKEMGLEVGFQNMQFDELITAVRAGKQFDCSISGITIDDERKKEVDFTDPYMDSNQSIAVMKNSGFTQVEQLEGKSIGVQSGTSGEAWANEHIKGADSTTEVIPFGEATAAFVALQSGQVDAVCMDLPVVADIIKNSYPEATIIKEIPTGEQYGIAVNKDNPALRDAFNEALKTIKENGTYDKIYEKWFGVE